jgi:hypothetical protein
MRTRRVPRATRRPRGREEVLPSSSVVCVSLGVRWGGEGSEGSEDKVGIRGVRDGGRKEGVRGMERRRVRRTSCDFLDVVEDEVHELIVAFECSGD